MRIYLTTHQYCKQFFQPNLLCQPLKEQRIKKKIFSHHLTLNKQKGNHKPQDVFSARKGAISALISYKIYLIFKVGGFIPSKNI